MNYFELFAIQPTLRPDREHVRRKYVELTRRHHPDYFAKGNADEQTMALEQSAEINRGYKILSDRDQTIRYVLQLEGLLREEEKYPLDQEFLMEMMELNEALMEGGSEEVGPRVESVEGMLDAELEPLMNEFDQVKGTDAGREVLLKVKDVYMRKKYLVRLKEGISKH